MWLPVAGRFQPGKDTDFGCFSGKGKKRFRKWLARAKRAPKRVFVAGDSFNKNWTGFY